MTDALSSKPTLADVTQLYCYNGCYSVFEGSKEKHMKKYHKGSTDGYFLGVLPNDIICPHCDQILFKFINLKESDWVAYSCNNKLCPYKKKTNGKYHITEFNGERKKVLCKNHHYSGDEKCKRCIEEVEFNKRFRKVVARVFS